MCQLLIIVLLAPAVVNKNNLQASCLSIHALTFGCLESVEWNGGMDYWNGILEWTGTRSLH